MTIAYKILQTDTDNGTFIIEFDGLQPLNYWIPNDGSKFLTGQELEDAIQNLCPGIPNSTPSIFSGFPNKSEIENLVNDNNEFLAKEATIMRESLLLNSDWTQLPDAPLTNEKKVQWASYRQSLRDITTQSGFPKTINWPVAPTK
jgi:hypothetical protein